ncbi:MAG: hypothetical protein GEU90_01965 [Gemmatimonas sp.]|nr:hypothetical protein [Gemmatimonas sp.]
MPRLLHSSIHDDASRAGDFTIRSALKSHGAAVHQTQFVTDQYVVTSIGGSTFVFAPGLDGRFRVDRMNRQLYRVDVAAQNPRPEQVRSLLGDLEIECDESPVEIDGRRCRVFRVHNRDARLVVSIECYCARIEGLERSALVAEREFDGAFQPFQLPLDDDEIVVRSTTRALAADFEQSQTVQLVALEPRIEGRDLWEEVLRYPMQRG